MRKRADYIDYIRGGAVLLVLLHHCGILQSHILAFHMPLFFFLSGYVFHLNEYKKEKFFIYLNKRIKRLIVPYLLFELLNLLAALLLHYLFIFLKLDDVYHVEIFHAFRHIFMCIESSHYIGITNLFWFLPCLFLADIMMWFINKLIRKIFHANLEVIYILLFCVFVCLSFIENKLVSFRLPFTLDIALMAVAFVCLGYSSKRIVDWCYKQQFGIQFLFVIVGLIGLVFAVNLNSNNFLMFINQYGDYFYAVLGSISGIFFFCNLIFVSKDYLPKSGLLFLSINSLVFYPVHLDVLALLGKIMSYITFPSVVIIFLPLIKVLFVTVLIIPCIWYINKYCPIMAGLIK
jgi:fucose 4-O-acetylase-like acetyltransferase